MTTYHVKNGGDDSKDGLSDANAWETATKVSDEIGNGRFNPGDFIGFKRGDSWTFGYNDYIEFDGCSGTIRNHIALGAYGVGPRPVFDGDNGTNVVSGIIYKPGSGDGNYWTLRDIEFQNVDNRYAVALWMAHHWWLWNCYFHDFDNTVGDPTRPGSGITIRNQSEYCWVDNCTFETIYGEAIYIGWASNEDRTRRIVMKNCVLDDCRRDGIDLKPYTGECFIFNTIINNCGQDDSEADEAVNLGGRYHKMYQCRITGSGGSFDTEHRHGISVGHYHGSFPWSGHYITVERCLIEGHDSSGNPSEGGAVHLNGSHNRLINNVIASSNIGIRGFSASAGGHEIKNNVFYDIDEYPVKLYDAQGRFDFDHNDYGDGSSGVWYESGASRDFSYVQGLGQETNGITDAPDFAEIDHYTLNPTSPCVDEGDSSETVYTWEDKYGESGAVDMGWQEYDFDLPHRAFDCFFDEGASLDERFTGYTGVSAAGGRMVVHITDQTTRYAWRSSLGNLEHFYAAPEINVDSLTMASGDSFVIFHGRTTGGTALALIRLYYDGSDIQVGASIINDSDSWSSTGWFTLDSGDNLVEIYWQRAPDSSYNHGELILWVNEVKEAHIEDVDNHDRMVDAFYIGAVAGLDVGTSGYIYFDDVRMDWLRYLGEHIEDEGGAVYKTDPNLQALYLLEEASGNRSDSSQNSNTLTDNNTVESSADCQEGSKSADFESGNDEYLSIADGSQTGLDITGDMTLCAWIKPESWGGGTMAIVSKWNESANRSYLLLIATNGTEHNVECWLSSAGGSAEVVCETGTDLSTATWYHVAAVYNGEDIRIYLNGALDSYGPKNPKVYEIGIYDGSADFRLGKTDDGDNFDGLMDEVAVFDRALTATEINDIYQNGIQDAPTGGQPRALRGLMVPGLQQWTRRM